MSLKIVTAGLLSKGLQVSVFYTEKLLSDAQPPQSNTQITPILNQSIRTFTLLHLSPALS